jgi:hypothetical protein
MIDGNRRVFALNHLKHLPAVYSLYGFPFLRLAEESFRLVCFPLMLSPKKLCKDTKKNCALRINAPNKHDFCILEVQIKKGEKSQGANKLGVSYPFEQHLMRFPPDSHRFSAIISEQVRSFCKNLYILKLNNKPTAKVCSLGSLHVRHPGVCTCWIEEGANVGSTP